MAFGVAAGSWAEAEHVSKIELRLMRIYKRKRFIVTSLLVV
jgi:hypothetical protein